MPRILPATPVPQGVSSSHIRTARGKYSFAVQGGTQGTIALMGSTVIPSGALVLGGYLKVGTTLTSGGSATVAVQVEGANDLVTATAYGSSPWSTTGVKAVVPVFTAATFITTTAARDISIVIATADLTAGIFDVVLFYLDPLA